MVEGFGVVALQRVAARPPLFATLTLAKINVRAWLSWYLESCAENGGRAPSDITPLVPWKMSVGKRREMAVDPKHSTCVRGRGSPLTV
jgi:hypothetical protein